MNLRNGLIIGNILFFFSALGLGEICHRQKIAKEIAFKNHPRSMNKTEFDEFIKNGKKYAILDNFVIDFTDFVSEHPGGQFVIN